MLGYILLAWIGAKLNATLWYWGIWGLAIFIKLRGAWRNMIDPDVVA